MIKTREKGNRGLSLVVIVTLFTLVLIAAAATINASDAIPDKNNYPPYPEIWYRAVPAGQWAYFRSPDGDLFIEHEVTSAAPTFRANGVYFFSGKEARGVAEHQRKYSSVFKKLMFQLPAGSLRPGIALGQFTRQLHPLCPQALNSLLEIKYPNGRVEQLTLLYVLDKPIEREVRPECNSTEGSYVEKVVALAPVFFPLADETFLVLDEKYGLVLRFDKKLATRTELMNKKIFLVNADLIRQYWEDEEISYQKMQDKVLKNLK